MKTNIKVNNLSHNTVQAKLFGAMRRSSSKLNISHMHSIANNKGKVYLHCHYLVGDTAWNVLGKSSGFYWQDENLTNITDIVTTSLRTA